MRKLSRLWLGIESVPGLVAIPAYWEHFCGPDFALVRRHLRPTDDLGAAYPCPRARDYDCPRRVIDYFDGTFAAICRHPHKLCDTVPLTQGDALAYSLDMPGILLGMADLLGVRSGGTDTSRPDGVVGLGLSTNRPTRNQPVFLLVFAHHAAFESALRNLIFSCPTPFVVVAPTGNHLTVELRENLSRRQSEFIALEDRVGLSDDGRFGALEIGDGREFEPTPVEQRQAAVETYKRDFSCTDQTIFEDSGVDKADFYKWMRGALSDKSIKSKRIEETLRSRPKTRTRR